MEYILQLILRRINQALICLVDGEERSFANGEEAIAELMKDRRHYAATNISARENTVVLVVRDISEDIKKHNEKFIAENKKRFGCEPNLFDGL